MKDTIEKTLESFIKGYTIKKNHRYASFDFCYNYFKSQIYKKDKEKACAMLGYYLASHVAWLCFFIAKSQFKSVSPYH
ncbi:hypothetical protein [Helicobacter cetorum]|uniref:Uncharacterized protein n=1 Tax=Helicobacter cetorum (strain ATCC BAA-540 / CCUG 52418 / MIT 99-5656) TaxID=1163745 RepID=I0ETD4_HELCM|nr:hypothetical protein [Helicobacter cetorum]AFI06203.1 hypothetical protein HCD_06005 [Helicobacter cetorum MIT 99-5656]